MTKSKPDIEELTLIRDYVLLPHLLTLVERSRESLETSSVGLRDLLSRFLIVLADRVMTDIVAIKREFSRRNIKVVEDTNDGDIYRHKIFVRGYTETFGIMRYVMRSEIQIKLTRYTAELMGLKQPVVEQAAEAQDMDVIH